MANTISIACRCGKVHLTIEGPPILAVECCCSSCQAAGSRMAALPGAPDVRTSLGATPYVVVRKDRVRIVSGAEQLREFRLKPDSPTRRVVAACCNTPLFTDFGLGHWLSVYRDLWPEATRPPIEMRTNVASLPEAHALPDDVPNLKGQSARFFGEVLLAFVAMGFRRPPKIATAGELPV